MSVVNSTFVENNAQSWDGGGISAYNTYLRLSNCLFLNNYTGSDGGGVRFRGATWYVNNCTFHHNTAVGKGGGIYVQESTNTAIRNSILWDNVGDQQLYSESGASTPVVTYCDIDQDGFAPDNGNIRSDPLFVNDSNDASGDFHLKSGSPCIDTGDDSQAQPYDMEGLSRYDDPDAAGSFVSDIGAYEYKGVASSGDPLCEEVQFYDSRAYRFCDKNRAPWTAADAYCRSFNGGELVVVDDASENIFVRDLISSVNNYNAWINVNDRDNDGAWTTTESNNASYFNWGDGEPNGSSGDSRCGAINSNSGAWSDTSCTGSRMFICKSH